MLLANESREVAKDGPKGLGSITHIRDPDGVPGSWLQLDPDLAIVAILGHSMGQKTCTPPFKEKNKSSGFFLLQTKNKTRLLF